MGARRVPHERVRWFSSVLIVAAIAAASVALRWSPAPAPLPPFLAASHPLRTFVVPPLRPQPVRAIEAALRVRFDRSTGGAQVTHADVPGPSGAPGEPPAAAGPLPDLAVSVPADPALPAGRSLVRLAIAAVPPAPGPWRAVAVVPGGTAAAWIAVDHGLPGLVEFPALAVTRAGSAAGRGIRTGLRATMAMFRAAF